MLLVSGDDEYRSEEALPMLGQVLAAHHGFDCRVTFSVDPATGHINPEEKGNLPGLEALETADIVVLFLRFRRLSDTDMARVARYVESGKPLIALRTATHAFAYEPASTSPYAHWSWDHAGPNWKAGFGGAVLGTSWVAHHGAHGSQSTRGVVAEGAAMHPILRGVSDVWGPSDVYAVSPLPQGTRVLLEGSVQEGMQPTSPAVVGAVNQPRMPLVWIQERQSESKQPQRVLCSTIGAATDFACEDLRRLLVNAVYWGCGLEDQIPERAQVAPVVPYQPSAFGFGTYRRGVKPADHAATADQLRSDSK